MDNQRAQALLADERRRVEALLVDTGNEATEDRDGGDRPGDWGDGAEPLSAEAADDAVRGSLQSRLEAIERAEARLAAGTYGRSVRSGEPIPPERLEADPAAELTVDEANADPTT
jgi:DnaK suppressor protein